MPLLGRRTPTEFSELLSPTLSSVSLASRRSLDPQQLLTVSSMGSFVCDVDGTRRNNTFLVLRFDEHGKHVYLEMTRNDILQTIRQAERCPSGTSVKGGLPCVFYQCLLDADELVASTNLPPTTKERSGSISPLGAYCDLQPVHMRDLRQLDESFSESNETSIVVRKQAILINADPIRSIIMRNAALILVPDGADSLLSMLIKDFHDCVEIKDSTTPYEFRALEAILDTLSRILDDEYDRHAAEIGEMLDSLVSVRIISGELETMRLMKNSMNAFEAQVDSVRRALMELLDNEEDLRLLYLTKLSQEPSLIYALGSFDPEEVEILLESYMKDIYTTRTKSELLQHRVHSTESLITMKLDYARNYLLALQLIFSLAGVGLGVGTLIAGIFGMNLTMGIPNTVASFWWVDAAIVASCIGIIWGGIIYFRHQGLMIST